jgi:hypothetical protein
MKNVSVHSSGRKGLSNLTLKSGNISLAGNKLCRSDWKSSVKRQKDSQLNFDRSF